MGAKTINDLYRTLDETIADIIVTLNIPIEPEMERMLQRGVKYFEVPLRLNEFEGATVHQVITDAVCPVPGQIPLTLRRLLPRIDNAWNYMMSVGELCDPDFTSYVTIAVFDLYQDFQKSTSRSDLCE